MDRLALQLQHCDLRVGYKRYGYAAGLPCPSPLLLQNFTQQPKKNLFHTQISVAGPIHFGKAPQSPSNTFFPFCFFHFHNQPSPLPAQPNPISYQFYFYRLHPEAAIFRVISQIALWTQQPVIGRPQDSRHSPSHLTPGVPSPALLRSPPLGRFGPRLYPRSSSSTARTFEHFLEDQAALTPVRRPASEIFSDRVPVRIGKDFAVESPKHLHQKSTFLFSATSTFSQTSTETKTSNRVHFPAIICPAKLEHRVAAQDRQRPQRHQYFVREER